MNVKSVNIFKGIAHVIFILTSIALTVMLFEQLSVNFIGKVVFVSIGIGLELVKVYLFLFVKFHFKHKRVGFLIGSLYLFVYLSLAGISAVASLGFALNEIGAQSFQAGVSNIDSDSILRDIEFIEREIETKVRQQSELPHDWVTASERFSTQIRELRQERAELIDKLQSREQGRELVSSDTFTLIGELSWIDRSGEDVLFFILMFLVVMLEVVIALTSGNIYDTMPKKKISKGGGFDVDHLQEGERKGIRSNFTGKTGLRI